MKVESCPICNCCVNKKHLEHCGSCDELPCATFLALCDSTLSDEEAEKALVTRQNDLPRRKQIEKNNGSHKKTQTEVTVQRF
jgi:hypothetical protein